MHYFITTRHGRCETADSYDEALQIAKEIMQGYLEARTCANDPMPKIFKTESMGELVFNQNTKVVDHYDPNRVNAPLWGVIDVYGGE